MQKIKKIKEKVELKDVEVQGDPCKQYHDPGSYDCAVDCKTPSGNPSPKGSLSY
ncbi:hypothetical protein [Metaclostridioides mangenotii]|uniref:hypothetical protein n=1 Tax=Metaclostridioides mangenotii TaxID=1540 RepID=UPI0026EB693F|nr:hypothetical protein [Clostridioides mangenotii]